MPNEQTFPHYLAEYLRDQWAYLESHQPIVREGGQPVGVHQMRVTTRRLRSILSATKFVYPDKATKSLRADLKALAGKLAPARDLDVLLANLAGRAPGLTRKLEAIRAAAQAELLAYLDGPGYRSLKTSFQDFAAQPAPAQTSVGDARDRLIPPRVRSVLESGRDIDPETAADDQLHDFRKRVKKLRYLAELFDIAPLAEASAAITGLLGKHQDACVELEKLKIHAGGDSALAESPKRNRLEIRAAFPEAWRQFQKATAIQDPCLPAS